MTERLMALKVRNHKADNSHVLIFEFRSAISSRRVEKMMPRKLDNIGVAQQLRAFAIHLEEMYDE